jgi:hypothetical protein
MQHLTSVTLLLLTHCLASHSCVCQEALRFPAQALLVLLERYGLLATLMLGVGLSSAGVHPGAPEPARALL